MDTLLYKTVERMLGAPGSLSRNRNFVAFEDPGIVRAGRIARRLASLRADLRRYGRQGAVAVTATGAEHEAVCIEVRVDALHATRITRLDAEQVRLLRQDAEVAAILDAVAHGAG